MYRDIILDSLTFCNKLGLPRKGRKIVLGEQALQDLQDEMPFCMLASGNSIFGFTIILNLEGDPLRFETLYE